MRNEILYIGSFKLPDCDAAAVRVSGIAKALHAAGYTVTLVGYDFQGQGRTDRRMPPFERMSLVARRGLDYFFTSSSYLRKIELIDWQRVAATICYPGSASLIIRLMYKCRNHSVPLIIDCTEWYESSHTPGGRLGPFAIDSEFRMRWLNVRAKNVICISSFLTRHYSRKGCHVVRIPPLVDMDADEFCAGPIPLQSESRPHLSLAYAGFPGRKENLSEIVAGVQASRQRGVKVTLYLVGITEGELRATVSRDGGRPSDLDGITCYGKVPREKAIQIVAHSDFTVILRPQKRFANAGFPSKLVESLSLGVPVIANSTSDISEYLRDGLDGFLLSEPAKEDLEKAINIASQATFEQRAEMRNQASLRARECFDYRNYVDILANFIASARPCD